MQAIQQLSGNTTVQASAGSGKTYLLVSRIIRLLLSGAEPGSILAITFTRKAANEMQTRLLQRLYQLATDDIAAINNTLQELDLDINDSNQEKCRNLYEQLLRHEQPVKTTTFHAFCQDLLHRFPMEADVPANFELLDHTRLLYDEAWDALMMDASGNQNPALKTALSHLFKEFGPNSTRTALDNFLHHRSDWWAYTLNQQEAVNFAVTQLEHQLEIAPGENPLEKLFKPENLELISEFHQLLVKHDIKTHREQSEQLYHVINTTLTLDKRYESIKSAFLTKTGEARKRSESKPQSKSMGDEGQARFLELHYLLCEKILETKNRLAALNTYHTNQSWYRAGSAMLEYFQKIKTEQRLLDFTDLEWQAYLLLNMSNNALWIQYKLDQRINHLLVDEFQDTNPTQWHLIKPLLDEMAATEQSDERSVFLVGDEKQSIYRFRRAEPRLFNAAEQWLTDKLSATTSTLSHSWRSSPAIINFLNKLFLQEKTGLLIPGYREHFTHKENLAGKVTLMSLNCKEEIEEELIAEDFRNPLFQPRVEHVHDHFYREGIQVANEISRLIDNKVEVQVNNQYRAINYSDIIILLRSRTHVEDYEMALRESGIPYIGANRGTLLDSLEINDILDLLQWLTLPFDNLSLAGILRSPVFDLSSEELIVIQQAGTENWYERLVEASIQYPGNVKFKRAKNLLSRWKDYSAILPVHDLLDKIYSEGNILQRYQSSFPSHLKHRVVANLSGFLELALEMDSGRYPSITRFSEWIKELRQLDNDAPDEPVSKSGEHRVRILSIHAAKGLEAPVVFLADAASKTVPKNAYTTLVDWPAENKRPDHFLLTGKKETRDHFSSTCLEKQAALEQREDANLLYVALTRARQYLYISGSESQDKNLGWYGLIQKLVIQDSSAVDNNASQQEDIVLEDYVPPSTEVPADTTRITASENTIDNDLEVDARLAKPVSYQHLDFELSPSQISGDIPEPHNTGTSVDHTYAERDSDNTERGILIHAMLDYLTRYPGTSASDFINSSHMPSAGSHFTKDEFDTFWKEAYGVTMCQDFQEYFNPKYYTKAYNEVPIEFMDDSQLIYGIIDRLLLTDYEAIILDYKTHPYATEKNVTEIADHYIIQMQAYKKGVELLWPDKKIQSRLVFTACMAAINI